MVEGKVNSAITFIRCLIRAMYQLRLQRFRRGKAKAGNVVLNIRSAQICEIVVRRELQSLIELIFDLL